MHIEVWQNPIKGGDQKWRWRFRARNGRITAAAESFPTKSNAMRAAKAVVRGVVNLWPGTPVYFTAKERDGKTEIRWS